MSVDITTQNGSVENIRRQRSGGVASDDSVGRQYEGLLARMQSSGFFLEGGKRTIGIVSTRQDEGVTTVACNLAFHAAASRGLHVLLVDANHTRPDMHRRFQLQNSPGLGELLNGEAVDADCITDMSSRPLDSWPRPFRQSLGRSKGILRFLNPKQGNSSAPQLSVMTAGANPAGPRSLHNFGGGQLLEHLVADFDLVVVDLPPVSSAIGCSFPLANLDGILFVLEAETTTDIAARKSITQLKKQGADVLGVAFNKCRNHLPGWIEKKLGD